MRRRRQHPIERRHGTAQSEFTTSSLGDPRRAERARCSQRRSQPRYQPARRSRAESRPWPRRRLASSAGGHGSGGSGAAYSKELGVLDKEQAALMSEECILVDRDDKPTGPASKVKDGHSKLSFPTCFPDTSALN